MSERPYLSVVVTARNDDHAGDFLERMKIFIRGLAYQSLRHKLPIELIVVEWNPPPDRPLLHEVLPKPEGNAFLRIRYIIVPHAIHQQYRTHSFMGLYQMTAKNVGIRRASADYVLCTNVDVIFSDALASFLSKKCLRKGFVYRSVLCHIPAIKDARFGDDIGALLRFASSHTLKRQGGVPLFVYLYVRPLSRLLNYLPLRSLSIWLTNVSARAGVPYLLYYLIDTMACGDFTLMHKDHWMSIEGYAELDAYSMHIDVLGLGAAMAIGVKQHILPVAQCLYHVSHDTYHASDSHKAAWSQKEMPEALKRVFCDIYIPSIHTSSLLKALKVMTRTASTFPANNPDWGFVGEELKEYVIGPS